MADKKRTTIFQDLQVLFTTGNPSQEVNYNENKRIIKANSKEELGVLELQQQQQNYLNKQHYQLIKDTRDKNLAYETNRLQQYFDYEAMEYYPIIASALNLLSEEATTIGQNGKMLNIYSTDSRVKRELEKLFYDILDINTVLPFWTRNLCKYGDNFVNLLLNENRGVIGAKQLPNIEIDRVEEEKDGKLSPIRPGEFNLAGRVRPKEGT